MLRIKGEGACVSQIDIDRLVAMSIVTAEDAEFGGYMLIAFFSGIPDSAVCLIEGNFDECHSLLNSVNDYLDISIFDIVQ